MSGEGGHIELAIALSTTRHKDGVAILSAHAKLQQQSYQLGLI